MAYWNWMNGVYNYEDACIKIDEQQGKLSELIIEIARLREAISSYQKSFDMEKRLFDITVKELRQENSRLHEYNRERWKGRGE